MQTLGAGQQSLALQLASLAKNVGNYQVFFSNESKSQLRLQQMLLFTLTL